MHAPERRKEISIEPGISPKCRTMTTDVGSSSSSNSGRLAMARAIVTWRARTTQGYNSRALRRRTRCCSPPLSILGKWLRRSPICIFLSNSAPNGVGNAEAVRGGWPRSSTRQKRLVRGAGARCRPVAMRLRSPIGTPCRTSGNSTFSRAVCSYGATHDGSGEATCTTDHGGEQVKTLKNETHLLQADGCEVIVTRSRGNVCETIQSTKRAGLARRRVPQSESRPLVG